MKISNYKTVMMMMAIAIIIPISGGSVFGQEHQRPERVNQQRIQSRMHAKIALTDDQKEQLSNLRTARSQEVRDLTNQLNEHKAHLKTLLDKAEVSPREVEKTVESIGKIQTDLMKIRVGQQIEMKKILSPEQMRMMNHQRMAPQRKMGQRMDPPHQGRMGHEG